jgi:hypothetical protein
MLSPVIDWLYTSELILNSDNVVALLAISEYYEIPVLQEIAFERFQTYLEAAKSKPRDHQEILLKFVKSCSKFNVIDHGKELIPPIADHFSTLSRVLLYESLNPTLLTALLLHEKLSYLSEDDRLTIADSYDDLFPVAPGDQPELATIATWGADFSHEYLVRHRCRWMPASITRPLYRRLMKCRRSTARAFRSVASASGGDTSRWFSFTRLQAVMDGKADPPPVETVAFMRTRSPRCDLEHRNATLPREVRARQPRERVLYFERYRRATVSRDPPRTTRALQSANGRHNVLNLRVRRSERGTVRAKV